MTAAYPPRESAFTTPPTRHLPAAYPPQVRRINDAVGGERGVSIGVLDIFGFEIFETNSFEQVKPPRVKPPLVRPPREDHQSASRDLAMSSHDTPPPDTPR